MARNDDSHLLLSGHPQRQRGGGGNGRGRHIAFALFSLIVLIVVVVLAVTLATSDRYMRVQSLIQGGETVVNVQAFSESHMVLHANGVFDVQIVYRRQVHFVALGTFERSSRTIDFTFTQAWFIQGGVMSIDSTGLFAGETKRFDIYRNKIRFEDNAGIVYWFR